MYKGMLTMTEIEYSLSDLIRFSSEQKPIEFGTAFNSLLTSKIESEIDARKIEVAQAMFNNHDDSETVDFEQEED
jgi:hypothetical protein